MSDLSLLQCVARCTTIAGSLTGFGGGAQRKPRSGSPHDTDTDTDTDADASEPDHGLLEESILELDSLLKVHAAEAASNRHKDDALAIKELASNCKSLCGRVLAAVPSGRGPKRIATSLDTWKTSRPSAGSSRQGFELRKLAERLHDLQSSLSHLVTKTVGNYLATAKHQIRQIQLESRRLQCQKSDRLKNLSNVSRELETRMRALQRDSDLALSPDDILTFNIQLQDISDQQFHIKQDHAILKSLAFRSNVARHDTIPEAHQKTFSWVFSAPVSVEHVSSSLSLRDWLENGTGIFWVSGKPGAGKSTLMKFIADHNNTQEALAKWSAPKRAAIVSHYFWCAGTQMQRSHNGLLQTLLFEILRQLPDEIQSLFPERWSASNSGSWALADLYQALYDIVARTDLPVKFCFFIDGLDEFDGDHIALCHELLQLAKSENVKLCLSSRPWRVFEEAFGSGKTGQLCLHDVTKDDIMNFVFDQFSEYATEPNYPTPEVLKELATQIIYRSQGVFLWVSLATKCLLENLSAGHSPSSLLEDLAKYPPELDDFFTYNLNNIPPQDQNKMATSFLITEAAEKPLDIGIYYFHDMEFTNPDYVLGLSPEPPSRLEYRRQLSQITQQLQSMCHGLLAVDKKTGVVNCIHRTVRDYLYQEETKTMLQSKAPAGFSANVCLLRASTAWTKTSRASMSEEPKSEFTSSVASLIAAAAQLQDPAGVTQCQVLLDDLDQCLVAKGPGAEESLQVLRSQVVGNGLWRYLSDISSRQPGYFSHFEVPPLVLALLPGYEIGEVRERRPHWDIATANTVSCLLQQGQNPNKAFSTAETLGTQTEKSPWVVLCEHILPQHDDTHSGNIRRLQSQLKAALETGILHAFLAAGANANARCQRPGKNVSVVATDYLLNAFRLDAEADETLKNQYLEHLLWFAPKEADHLNAVINDFFRLIDRSQSSNKSAFLSQISEKLLALASQMKDRRR